MSKLILGCVLSLAIGAFCRWVDLPLPSPPKLQGALLIVAMTLGYLVVDRLIAARFHARGPATTQSLCGGPTGLPPSNSSK